MGIVPSPPSIPPWKRNKSIEDPDYVKAINEINTMLELEHKENSLDNFNYIIMSEKEE